MAGKVRVTKAGYLYFDFFLEGKRCREYTELRDSPKNRKIMQEALCSIDAEIRLGTFVYEKYFPGSSGARGSKSTCMQAYLSLFKEYAERWYENNRIGWKPSVRKDFRSTLKRHLLPYFGERGVEEITKGMLKEFRTVLSKQKGRGGLLTNKRINNIMGVLRLVLAEAGDEMEFMSPFADLKPLPVRRTDVMPLSLEEVFRFLDTTASEFRCYYEVRFFTGMRTAEIDGLQWKYVDFEHRRILVRETWQSGQWVTPKTESSVRDIVMSGTIERALKEQRSRTGGLKLVFCNRKGKPFDPNNMAKRIWYPTLGKAELLPRKPYQTRHTAATLWLASGENPEWVARQLGHANTEMLFKIYSRFIPNLTRRDGSAFEKVLNEKKLEYENTSEKEKESAERDENKQPEALLV